jgi:YidC/Oxa1 family membrane protein insertase
MLWQAWLDDYGPASQLLPTEIADALPGIASQVPPGAVTPHALDVPTDLPAALPNALAPDVLAQAPGAAKQKARATDSVITVQTDVLDISISPNGGTIVYAALRRYPVQVDQPEIPFVIFDRTAERYFISQGGLQSRQEAPDHYAEYEAEADSYVLEAGAEALTVPLRWRSSDGVLVTKQLTFKAGSYLIDINYQIDNQGVTPWSGRLYDQLQRAESGKRRGLGTYSFTGAVLSKPEDRYEKYDYDDLEDQPIDEDIQDGWTAVLEHYFVAAMVPVADQPYRYYSRTPGGNRYVVGAAGPVIKVDPGTSANLRVGNYVGPKLQSVLTDTAPGLELTVDYGWLWFIAKPLFILLQKIFSVTQNWGWSIILVTCIIKAVFFHLSAMGYRSMAHMRRVQPRLLALRERYSSDKTRMNQAMMQLYKEEKINPLGGCFPILVQIPVFIALYWVLLESVELRQASFIFWLQDLSTKDPFFVLPVLMGISMFVQQQLNPAPMDPMQEKVMKLLPWVFTVFFAFFPSGLVLYWVVNNTLSILQQWVITRRIDAQG